MSIEFKFQTVQIDQEQLPALLSMMNLYMPKRKSRKRRKPKKQKISASQLIQEIIDSIEE